MKGVRLYRTDRGVGRMKRKISFMRNSRQKNNRVQSVLGEVTYIIKRRVWVGTAVVLIAIEIIMTNGHQVQLAKERTRARKALLQISRAQEKAKREVRIVLHMEAHQIAQGASPTSQRAKHAYKNTRRNYRKNPFSSSNWSNGLSSYKKNRISSVVVPSNSDGNGKWWTFKTIWAEKDSSVTVWGTSKPPCSLSKNLIKLSNCP